MKKRVSITALLSLVLLTGSIAFAQPTYEWGVPIAGATASEHARDLVTDASGNVFVTGAFTGTVDFDPGTGVSNLTATNGRDGYVAKYDSNGNLIWAIRNVDGDDHIGGNYIELDQNGNIVILGTIQGGVTDLDPGAGVQNYTGGSYDWYVQKLDPNGNLLWAHGMGSSSGDEATALHVSNNGDVLVTGYYAGTTDFDPGAGTANLTPSISGYEEGFIYKVDENGAFQWANTFPGKTSCYGVATNSSGEVFLSGRFLETADFDPGVGTQNVTSVGGWDAYVLKLTASGAFVWVKSFGGNAWDLPYGLALDNAENIFVRGYYQGTADFDPSAAVSNQVSNGAYEGFVQKLDPNGNYLWSVSIGGTGTDIVNDLAFDVNNNVYIAGVFQETVDFDPSGNVVSLTSLGGGTYDGYLECLNENGDFQWVVPYVSPDHAFNEAVGVMPNGDIYTCGHFQINMDLDPTAGVDTHMNLGSYDAFVNKLNHCISNTPTPNVASLPDLTGECSVAAPSSPTASNCTGTYNGTADVVFPVTTQGTTVVTWTYDDGNGNTSTQTQNVVIDDVTAPVADVVSLSDITAECEVTSLTPPTATDNCGGTVTVTHNATLPITTQGTTPVIWTYDDGNGNTSTQTQNVVIDDAVAPVADVASLSDITAECEVTTLTPPTATDNCAGSLNGTHNIILPITAQGTTVVIWTYDDGNGNTSTQAQNVVIDDVTAPVVDIASLPNITAECEVTTLTPPTATDNCGGTVTVTHNAILPITTQGTTIVTWTYDDGNGNTSTQTQSIVIDDAAAPVADIANLPDVTAQCEVTSLTPPTATDNCNGSISGIHSVLLPITSSTTITWTYMDGNGNTSSQTQNIIIDDVTDPVPTQGTLMDLTAECEVTTLTPPTATDNCAGSLDGTHNVTLPITTQGTTVVTWTYDDGNGNTSTQMQNIVITDVTAPVADVNALQDLVAECEVTTLTPPTATDNCAGMITGTHDASLPITSNTTVTWTYDDGNGNTSTQTQEVIINSIDISTSTTLFGDSYELSANASGMDYQWLMDCGGANILLGGETNQTFSPDNNGSYAVIIDNGTCSDTSDCITIDNLGIGMNELGESLKVYPNPTLGNFSIDFEDYSYAGEVKVYNQLGQVVLLHSFDGQKQIDLNLAVQPGLYIVEVETNEGKLARMNLIKE